MLICVYYAVTATTVVTVLRRSLNDEMMENVTNPLIWTEINIVEQNVSRSMACSEDIDADADDGFLIDLHSVLPDPVTSPCDSEDSPERNYGSSSSPGKFHSLSVQEESPPKTVASKDTQDCVKKSVAVQCNPTWVTQGVQCEGPLFVTRSVQCERPLLLTQSVQCERVPLVTQGVQCEPILKMAQSVQHEGRGLAETPRKAMLEVEMKYGLHENYLKSTSTSNSVSSPGKEQCNKNNLHTANPSITLPPLREELDIVTSPQTMICMSSSSSSSSSQNTQIIVRKVPVESSVEDQVNSSKTISSTSAVLRNEKGINENINRNICVETCDTSTHSSKNEESNGECSTNSGKCDKPDGKYSVEELLLEMASNKKYAESEDTICSEQSKRENNRNKREQQIAAQKTFDTSSTQHMTASICGKCDERLDNECSEDLLQERSAFGNCLSEGAESKRCEVINSEVKEQRIVAQKMIEPSITLPKASREVPASQTNTGGSQWYSSLTCERCSSPESLGEEVCEELREAMPYYYRNLYSKVQSKDTSVLSDANVSFQSVKCSTPVENDWRKSFVTYYYSDSHKSRSQKRKKVCHDTRNTDVIYVSSKYGGQLVPYSDSSSNTESDCDNTSEDSLELSRRIEQKHKKQTIHKPTGSEIHKVEKNEFKQKQESPARIQRSSVRLSQSNSGCSVETRRILVSDGESSYSKTAGCSGVQRKVIQSKQESPVKSKFIRHACFDIWASDDDDGSISSTVTKPVNRCRSRRRAPYTKLEREAILQFIIDHKCYKLVKGKALWERMEKDEVCPGRTWQSMREHFIKKILPEIDTFHLDPVITKKIISIKK